MIAVGIPRGHSYSSGGEGEIGTELTEAATAMQYQQHAASVFGGGAAGNTDGPLVLVVEAPESSLRQLMTARNRGHRLALQQVS